MVEIEPSSSNRWRTKGAIKRNKEARRIKKLPSIQDSSEKRTLTIRCTVCLRQEWIVAGPISCLLLTRCRLNFRVFHAIFIVFIQQWYQFNSHIAKFHLPILNCSAILPVPTATIRILLRSTLSTVNRASILRLIFSRWNPRLSNKTPLARETYRRLLVSIRILRKIELVRDRRQSSFSQINRIFLRRTIKR